MPPIPSSGDCQSRQVISDFARMKWKVLASAVTNIKSGKSSVNENVAYFPNFEVFNITPVSGCNIWHKVQPRNVTSPVSFQIRFVLVDQISLSDLTGFNNTGNVCVWPSEDCLSQYSLENLDFFRGKSIVELGGGMTSLCGLAIAAYGEPKSVLLTDGNQTSVENLKKICSKNEDLTNVSASLLRWNSINNTLVKKFDVVIAADCMFFDEGRPQLLDCVKSLLVPCGVALLMAPSRHGTFEKFVQLVKQDGAFNYQILDNFSNKISSVRKGIESQSTYDKNLHCPKLLKLCLK